MCCSDNHHCCPRGFKCSPDGKTCSSGAYSIQALSRAPPTTSVKGVNRLLQLITRAISKELQSRSGKHPVKSVICPDGSECPSGSTCCELASGQYGCCPFPKAVCCADKLHCCPNGYTCNVANGTCSRGSDSIPMLQKMSALKTNTRANVICPDGQSECPSGSTCCELASGRYGCCPFPKAVCCADKLHCCPNGYTCNVANGTCSRGSDSIPMLQKMSALKTNTRANVICPDGQSECPSGSTCCELASAQYGCCPLPKAVCCADKLHCCPNGYTCNVANGTCRRGSDSIPVLQKMSAIKTDTRANVICPDGQSLCPDTMTCCELASGRYGCCPFPKAVCCADKLHCCPNGYTCNVANGTCRRGSDSIPVLQKMSAIQTDTKANVICPDGQSLCPDTMTCCELASGRYGCCPFPKAVCCADKLHCCPNGYTCNVANGTCSRGSDSIPLLLKISALKTNTRANVICPDGESECPDSSTCCKLSSGMWGCCPLPNAVCCSDGQHCCPNGYTCDTSAGTCYKGSKTAMGMLLKIPALTRKAEASVVCPDGQSECPDGSTCCKLSSGQWGCCPLPNAVCCSDGQHCCPNGYTCDTSTGTCNKGSRATLVMLQKIPALKRTTEASVVCPNGQSQCPDGSTCCKLSSGQWGCCPLPNAVCCSDGEHCCPSGYTCDTSAGTCYKGSKTAMGMLQKITALTRKAKASVFCPDGQSECPDGSTCCKLSSGQWGCCPLPNAVCCSDGEHCCPSGYTCDTSAGTCYKGSKTAMGMLLKIPALTRKAEASVVCPDGQSECPDGSTCCKLFSGQWGCCPLPNAVCCSDGQHCCPNGYTCDTSTGTCNKESRATLVMLQKIPALKRTTVASVVCPDGQSECPDGSTCCKLSSGQWGCCPLPNAVCCSDGEHCCPSGYTCDTSAGTCYKGSRTTMGMLQKIPALKRKAEASVVCPDGQSECPDGSTCCKLSSGQWGCCPLPNAVCCSDGEHCCPSGYTCDTSAGTCSKGSKAVPMLRKVPALTKIAADNVVCPGGHTQCPSGSTCCRLSSGQWGCCPLPNAVCCSDGVHCCPNGYTCDTSTGTCYKGSRTTMGMLQKIPALKRKAEASVVCPDGESECPGGNTCCKLSSGQWGCCPLPKAVCCSDGEHCCPNGYTCNVANGSCSRGRDHNVLSEVQSAKIAGENVKTVFCGDGESECPDGYTCCKDLSGQYACCPLENAICCSDKVHCCPQGYTCNPNGTCHKSSVRDIQKIVHLDESPAQPIIKSFDSVLCPDKKYQCPNGNTCCKLHSGSYGCCPIDKAVCCNDDKHCCPEGYTCDVKQGLFISIYTLYLPCQTGDQWLADSGQLSLVCL